MRVARFEDDQGRVLSGELLDDHRAQLLERTSDGGWRRTNEVTTVRALLPPVAAPNIFAIGRNYRAHVEETGARLPDVPLVFLKPTTALVGHGAPIVLPAAAPSEVDFEAELAVVIGRVAWRVSAADALACVAGYTCANDVTARDCQRSDKQWSRAKGFDTFCPLGPWLVPAAEVDPDNLRICSRVNGRTMQDASTGQMVFSCRQLISYLSHQFTLLPGTVILTGTPEGVGFARNPPIFLCAGDRVEVEIEGIGTLVNPVERAASTPAVCPLS